MEDIFKNEENQPSPPPFYVPPPLLTAKEIEVEINKIKEDFIKTSLEKSKDELDAANELADFYPWSTKT